MCCWPGGCLGTSTFWKSHTRAAHHPLVANYSRMARSIRRHFRATSPHSSPAHPSVSGRRRTSQEDKKCLRSSLAATDGDVGERADDYNRRAFLADWTVTRREVFYVKTLHIPPKWDHPQRSTPTRDQAVASLSRRCVALSRAGAAGLHPAPLPQLSSCSARHPANHRTFGSTFSSSLSPLDSA